LRDRRDFSWAEFALVCGYDHVGKGSAASLRSQGRV
jgi:S-adenosylhomocysteine hydrolase